LAKTFTMGAWFKKFIFLIPGLLFTVAHFSCTEDKCKTVNCANGGTCSEGICSCPSGYEGPKCETVARKKFVKVWMAWDSGSIERTVQYPIVLSADTAITCLLISNFYNYFSAQVHARLTARDSIMIARQSLQGKTVEGNGYFDYPANEVHLFFDVTDSVTGQVDHRTAILY
jgi:EGF-like domain